MFRLIGIIVLLGLVSVLHGQQQNPFDLKYRPVQPRPETKTPPRPVVKDTFSSLPPDNHRLPTQQLKPDTLVSIMDRTAPDSLSDWNPFDVKKDSGESTAPVLIDKSSPNKDETSLPVVPVTTKKTSKGMQIFFLLLSLLFLIFIVNVERSFVKDLWRVISNENYSSLHLRNQRNTMRQILLLMGYTVFIIQAGIFLYHLLVTFHYTGTLLDNIWTCMLLVMAVYIVRHSAIRYLKWLFNNQKEMTLFGFDVSIFNIMVGLVLLPINVMLNFGPESLAKPLIYIGIIAAILAYLMRQLRWMLTARQLITNSLFLFFVYLCAVEILPLWAISKYFW